MNITKERKFRLKVLMAPFSAMRQPSWQCKLSSDTSTTAFVSCDKLWSAVHAYVSSPLTSHLHLPLAHPAVGPSLPLKIQHFQSRKDHCPPLLSFYSAPMPSSLLQKASIRIHHTPFFPSHQNPGFHFDTFLFLTPKCIEAANTSNSSCRMAF